MPKPETPRRKPARLRPDLPWRHRRHDLDPSDLDADHEDRLERARERLRLAHIFDPEYGE